MTRLHPAGSDDSYRSPWLATLPASYFRQFGDFLTGSYLPMLYDGAFDIQQDRHRRDLDDHLFVRMSQAQAVFIPWVSEAIDVGGKEILEFGCGSGSCTAPLAMSAKSVTGIDIDADSLEAASRRCELLGVTNAHFHLAQEDWLEAQGPLSRLDLVVSHFDIIVCYALLEHLTIAERLNFLESVWGEMRTDALLVIYETPNRFGFYDWHSSHLDFPQILPDELAASYYRYSTRSDLPDRLRKQSYAQLTPDESKLLYRWGRGASYHEFKLTIGLENMQVLNDGHSALLAPHRNRGWGHNDAFESGLAAVFDGLSPPVPRAFTRPSLDLVLAKDR